MNESATEPASQSSSKLSISYLFAVTTGVAVAIAISNGIENLRFSADAVYMGAHQPPKIDIAEAMVAALYGVCVTTFIFAWRSGNLWSSPGKTLAFLIASMCVLNWTLDVIAAYVMNYRMQVEVPKNELDWRPFIAGHWYSAIAAEFGYVVGLPIVAFVIFMTKKQSFQWQLVWIGNSIFALLMIGTLHFNWDERLPSELGRWYFQIATGTPVVLTLLALIITIARRQKMDWWTAIIGSLVVVVWSALLAMRLSGL